MKLTAKDITPELMESMRMQFEDSPIIRQMRSLQYSHQSKGMIPAAMEVGRQINDLFSKVVDSYVQEANEQAERMDVNDMGFAPSERKEIDRVALAMFMCCDIIETCILDFNDIIKRKNKEFEFEDFNEVAQLAKMVKGKLKMLSKGTTETKQIAWAEACDNMYSMMKNKAYSAFKKA